MSGVRSVSYTHLYVPRLHGYYLRPPKTATSSRTIRIDGQLLAELAAWRIMQACNCLLYTSPSAYL